MLKPEKFMGGTIKFVYPETDKLMPNGEKQSWEKSVKIVSGKIEIKVGRSFFEKIQILLEKPEVEQFLEDIE